MNHASSGLRFFALALAGATSLVSLRSGAAQLGPYIPSHRFPTDTSFHLGYRLFLINSSSNFTERLVTDTLTGDARLRLLRHEVAAEFQPSRKLSLGVRINLDSISLSSDTSTLAKRTTLGDQSLFAEFRVLDEPGSSLGFASMVKIPAYSNPTLLELTETGESHAILAGDAQLDTTLMLTTEYWLGTNLRMRGDVGYTLRLDGYAPELPYNVSVGVVNPKMDFELRLRGNFSLGAGEENDVDTQAIRDAFANSDYAYSPNPWVMVIEPYVELWLSAKTALSFQYSYSLMGNRTPSYHAMAAGFVYRWAETRNRPRKTFKEVPIGTDQEAGKFDGDASESDADSLYRDTDPVFE